MSDMHLSIIIVNWNTRELLRDCLGSVYEQTWPVGLEVIVVDNASSDGSVQMLEGEFPQVVVIANDANVGFAAANNQGMEIARGRFVLLLNSDTVVLDGAIDKALEFAARNSNAAVIGIRNEHPDGSLQRNCFQYASLLNLLISTTGLHRLLPQNWFFGRERMTWWDYASVRDVDVVAGCFMMVRKSAIDTVGMMDDRYFMYGEEMDWCRRFHQAGWSVLFFPGAKIIHYGGMSAAKNPSGMRTEQQRSLLRFIEKYQGRLARHAARALLCISGLIRLGYWTARWIVPSRTRRSVSADKIRQALAMSLGR